MRILVIEDDDDLREALAGVLDFCEYACGLEEAPNGAQALDLLKNTADAELPDLIILDLTMPVMNGFEFRETQLADDRIGKIPVLVWSGDLWNHETLAKLKPDFILTKPFDALKFDRILSTVAERKNTIRMTQLTPVQRPRKTIGNP